MNIKCAIYTRVSTDNQVEKEYNSCETQEERIKSFIDSQENLEIYNVYSDPGYSGASLDRPALKELLNSVASGNINCILTYKIDRLTRSPKDFYQLIELFDKYKVDFISVTERFDTSTPSGRLLRNIMLTFAQFERELTSERTKDKMLQRAQKGMWNGGIVSFGYKVKDKKLVIDKKESQHIKLVFDIFVETASLAKTYNFLKQKGVTNRSGKEISKSNIGHILRNIIYAGKIKYDNKIYDGMHEPIISIDQFNMAQDLFREKKKRINIDRPFFFAGLIRCKECGSSMTPSFINKNIRKRYYYYRCVSTFKHSWNSCSIKQINAEKLEAYIINKLTEISRDDNYIENWIFKLNHAENAGCQAGLELSQQKLIFDPKAVKEQLSNFLNSLQKLSEIDKISVVKNHIKKIIYSKDEICVTLYYRIFSSHQNNHKKSFSCPHPTKAFFIPQNAEKNTNHTDISMVRIQQLAPPVRLERTTQWLHLTRNYFRKWTISLP